MDPVLHQSLPQVTWSHLLEAITGYHPQSFWLSRSGVGPKNLHFQQFPGDAESVLLVWDHAFKNHWPRKTEKVVMLSDQTPSNYWFPKIKNVNICSFGHSFIHLFIRFSY